MMMMMMNKKSKLLLIASLGCQPDSNQDLRFDVHGTES